LGLGGGDEVLLAVGVEDDGVLQSLLQGSAAAFGVGEALAEVVALLAVEGALDGHGGSVGLAVEGLAVDAALVSEGRDIAIVAEENDLSAGEGGGRR